MAYIGNDVDAIFLPESVNTSTSLTITGGALTQTGGDVNFDSGTLFIDEDLNRVGIGTTNPTQKLQIQSGGILVKGAVTPNINFEPAGVLGNADISFDGNTFNLVSNSSSASLILSTSSSERLRITSAGNVGIGLTSPSTKLSVNGSITESTNGTDYWPIVTQQDIGTAPNQVPINGYLGSMAFEDSDSVSIGLLNVTGKIGVGTTNPQSRIHLGSSSVHNSADIDPSNTNLIIKQTSSTFRSGIYIERPDERRGYFTWINPNGGVGDALTFTRNNAGDIGDVLTLDRVGNVIVNSGNLVIGTSGKGIDFSATPNSSGTVSSELLDDYEEGAFTPSLTFGGGSTGITYEYRAGNYIKIGKFVFLRVGFITTNKGSSTGVAKITGLPFTIKSLAYGDATGACGFGGMTGLTGSLTLVGENFSTNIFILQSSSIMTTAINDSVFTNGSYIFGTFCYNVE